MRLLRDRVDSGYPVLEPLSVSYGAGMAGHRRHHGGSLELDLRALFSYPRLGVRAGTEDSRCKLGCRNGRPQRRAMSSMVGGKVYTRDVKYVCTNE